MGDDFYLATSSFIYFPGVPVFHSRDLVNWRQIGHCLTRSEQLPLGGESNWGGIYAPTLRYHNGLFYMITTNVPNYGHFYVTADDPAGPWSAPVRVEGSGFDPDLFFDDDGKVYFARHADDLEGIRMWEIDISTGELLGAEHKVWPGVEDALCEAPHLYKINGMYYLLAAEGGTLRSHAVVVGRSRHVTGPYESCPHNPILSHRSRVHEAIQQTGHGDLVQAADGSWWMVFLGIRLHGWQYHNLGRETFLAPVTWQDGWPVVNEGRAVQLQMDVRAPASQHPWEEPGRDDFNGETLALDWNFRKAARPGTWSLGEKEGFLTLHGTPNTLDDDPPLLVGRRQRHWNVTCAAHLSFAPVQDGEEAGLAVFMDERHHVEIALRREGGENSLILRKRIGELQMVTGRVRAKSTQLVLTVEATPDRYTFKFGYGNQAGIVLGDAAAKYVSTEVAGGFTGVYFGLYATSSGKPSKAAAYFDWFDYHPG